jgi:hypothetical protein
MVSREEILRLRMVGVVFGFMMVEWGRDEGCMKVVI